ncbi:hypothetical protein QEN19_003550 [Hanseniaspora menglaensis]
MFLSSRSSGSNARKRANNRTGNTTAVSGKDILFKAQLEREARQKAQIQKKATVILQKHFRLFLFRAKIYKSLIANGSLSQENIYLRNSLVSLRNERWILKFDKFFHWQYLKAILKNLDLYCHLQVLKNILGSLSLFSSFDPLIESITFIYDSIDSIFVTANNDGYLKILNDELIQNSVSFMSDIDSVFEFGENLLNDVKCDNEYRLVYEKVLNMYFYRYFATSETLFLGLLMNCKFAKLFDQRSHLYLCEDNFKVLNLQKKGLMKDFFKKNCILPINNIFKYSDSNILLLLSNLMQQHSNIKNSIVAIWNCLLDTVSFADLYDFTLAMVESKVFSHKLKNSSFINQVFVLIKVLFDRQTIFFKKNPINSHIVFNIYALFFLLKSDKLSYLVDRDILGSFALVSNIDIGDFENFNTTEKYKLFYYLKNTPEMTADLEKSLNSYYSFFEKFYTTAEYNNIVNEKSKCWPIEFYILIRANSIKDKHSFFFKPTLDLEDDLLIEQILSKHKDASRNSGHDEKPKNIYFSSFQFRKNLWKGLLAANHGDPMDADILLKVDRNNFFNDVMYHLNGNSGSSFAIEYKGEEGRGYGLKKEFLSEATKLFFYDLNLFSISPNGDGLTPNKDFLNHSVLDNLGVTETSFTNNQLVKNAGKIMAFIMLEGFTVQYKFSYCFWKKFLLSLYSVRWDHEENIYQNEFIDLQFEDYELYSNLLMLFRLSKNEVDSLGLFMEYKGIDLVANGNQIPVTYQNLYFYIRLVTDFKLNNNGIENFMREFVRGFKLVIQDELELELLSSFLFGRGKEISFIVNGTSLDRFPLDDFIENLKLQGYTQNDQTIKDLVYILKNEFNNDQLIKFFHFITSLRAPPFNGFESLSPSICITKITDPDFMDSKYHLPSSSTCFNLLRLPDYKNKNTLLQKLTIAIEDKSGFNLA